VWPDLAVDPKSKGEKVGEREEHDEHEEHEDSRTHTNPIQPILTPVARWTTPIESPTEETAVEFLGERPVLEKKIGERERVLTLESHSQI
jgi:hypothetical protein